MGMKSMPPIISADPNVKRVWPVSRSTPTVPSAKPTSAEITPYLQLPSIITMSVIIPIMTRRKNSGGPKLRVTSANSGVNTVIRMTPTVPPTNDATACMTSAGPARPCWASG